jgi:3-hydroxyacyl-[acyl-carrier-protein] dehydratase
MTPEETMHTMDVLTLSALDVRGLLPQREPFLFVNGPTRVVPGVSVVAHATFAPDSHFYAGHFPGSPLTPGVIIVETMAQAASLIMLTTPRYKGQIGYFVGIREAKFCKPVYPGQPVVLEGHITAQRHGIIEASMQASVDGIRAATAILTVTFRRPQASQRQQETQERFNK